MRERVLLWSQCRFNSLSYMPAMPEFSSPFVIIAHIFGPVP